MNKLNLKGRVMVVLVSMLFLFSFFLVSGESFGYDSPLDSGFGFDFTELIGNVTYNINNTTTATYTAGSNLTLVGTEFSLDTSGVRTWLDNFYLLNTGDTATGNYTFDSNTLFIDSDNDNIGIGTSSPTIISGFNGLTVNGSSGGFVQADILRAFTDKSSEGGEIQISNSSGDAYWYIDDVNAGLRFREESDLVLYFEKGGNVGIGTDSPGVMGFSGNSYVTQTNLSSGVPIYEFARGTNVDNDIIGSIFFSNDNNLQGTTNNATAKLSAVIEARVETSDSNAGQDAGSHLSFRTKPEEGTLATAIWIDDNQNVGIGTSSPSAPLHLENGDTTATANAQADEFIIESVSDPMGMSFLSQNGERQDINFGDVADNDIGKIVYDHGFNIMDFYVGANHVVRLNSGGELIIDSTSDAGAYKLQVAGASTINGNIRQTAGHQIQLTRDSVNYIVADDSSGSIQFVTGGSVGSGGNNMMQLSSSGTASMSVPLAGSGNRYVCVDTSENLYDSSSCSSSIFSKYNITNLNSPALQVISNLQPVTFNFKNLDEPSIGFIAENITYPFLLAHTNKNITNENNLTYSQDEYGYIVGVNYNAITTLNTKAIQEVKDIGKEFKQGMKSCIANGNSLQEIKDCVALL